MFDISLSSLTMISGLANPVNFIAAMPSHFVTSENNHKY